MSMLKEFSIQLYSLREETEKDFLGVLDKLSEIGYTGVEFAGYGNISAKDMKAALDKNKLKSIGTHVSFERLTNNLNEELEYNKVLGTEYIICPGAKMDTKEDAIRIAKEMNPIAKKVSDAGFKFAYHNHDFEFKKEDNKYLLDYLFENLDVDTSFMELDLFWTAFAGVDYLKYMQANSGRVKLLHLKQIKDHESKECVDLNQGVIDFKEIIKKAQEIGVEHFVLEQEKFEISPYISVKNGFDHIMSL